MDTKMQMSRCAELAAEAVGRLPGEIRANRRDLPLQGVHDVALRIELQGRIELHVQHFESRHLHFHRAVAADPGRVFQLPRPHSHLAGPGGGAVPAPRLRAPQRVVHRGHGSLQRTPRPRAAAGPRVHTGRVRRACLGFVWGLHCQIEGKMQKRKKGKKKEINEGQSQILQAIEQLQNTV